VGESPDAPQALPETQLAGQVASEAKSAPLGLEVGDVPDELMPLMGLKKGVGALITAVEPGSSAFEAGLAPGDVILTANRKQVHGAAGVRKLTSALKQKELTVLYVQRGPQRKMYVPVRAEKSG
jgi:S1-C subfamily serine protease